MTAIKSTSVPAQSHELSDNTQAFMLERVGGKDIFYSVTDPDYGAPKATIFYHNNAGEISETITDKIEAWSDAGYRVVTYDQPGTGQSYIDSQVGNTDVVHVDSFQENTDAAKDVLQQVQNNFEFRPENKIHFVAAGTGSFSALDSIDESAANQVQSVTLISPTLGLDKVFVPEVLYRTFRNLFADAAAPDGLFEDFGLRDNVTGQRVEASESAFVQNHPQRQSGPLSVNYVSEMFKAANAIENFKASGALNGNHIKTAIKSNGIAVTVLADTKTSYGDGGVSLNWGESIDARVVDLRNGGIDPHADPKQLPTITAEIERTVEATSPYVTIANNLREVHRAEWQNLPEDQRQLMQRNLEGMDYSVGVNKDDGISRHGGVSDTEHALAQLMIDQCVDPHGFSYDQDSISKLVQDAKDGGFNKPDPQPDATVIATPPVQGRTQPQHQCVVASP